LARGRVWQGIRDWFRPVDGGARNISQRAGPGSRSDRAGRSGLQNGGASGGTRSNGFSRWESARALLPAEGRDFGSGFRDGGGVGEVTLDFDQTLDLDLDLGHDLAIDERELLDFIAADVDPVPADPGFSGTAPRGALGDGRRRRPGQAEAFLNPEGRFDCVAPGRLAD